MKNIRKLITIITGAGLIGRQVHQHLEPTDIRGMIISGIIFTLLCIFFSYKPVKHVAQGLSIDDNNM